jgi:hypothetical protein
MMRPCFGNEASLFAAIPDTMLLVRGDPGPWVRLSFTGGSGELSSSEGLIHSDNEWRLA